MHPLYPSLTFAVFTGPSVWNVHPISLCLPDSTQLSKINLSWTCCVPSGQKGLYIFLVLVRLITFWLFTVLIVKLNPSPLPRTVSYLTEMDSSYIYLCFLYSKVSYLWETVQYRGKSKSFGMGQTWCLATKSLKDDVFIETDR